jgi:hypothetical protein
MTRKGRPRESISFVKFRNTPGVNFTPDVSRNSRVKLNTRRTKIHRRIDRSARASAGGYDVLDFANPVEALITLRKTSFGLNKEFALP